MANDVRYTAARARKVENDRLVWLDGDLRRLATLTLDAYLAEQRASDSVNFLEEDLPEWIAGHAALVARVAELPAGEEGHAHEFGLRKIAPRITRREGEVRRGQWLVAPCSCGRVCA